ncbi:hypothetical protein [Streptomyces sp. JNUCC 63]
MRGKRCATVRRAGTVDRIVPVAEFPEHLRDAGAGTTGKFTLRR